jgi:hypothetical protein
MRVLLPSQDGDVSAAAGVEGDHGQRRPQHGNAAWSNQGHGFTRAITDNDARP